MEPLVLFHLFCFFLERVQFQGIRWVEYLLNTHFVIRSKLHILYFYNTHATMELSLRFLCSLL